MKLRITLDGVTYDLDVEFLDEATVPTQPLPTRPAPSASASAKPAVGSVAPSPTPPAGATADKTVTSPLSATVFKILVKVGDRVDTNQDLLVLQAMKMETNVVAAAAGVIKNIPVAEGAAVSQGQVLIEFE